MGTISQFSDLASRVLPKSYRKLIPRRSVHSAVGQHLSSFESTKSLMEPRWVWGVRTSPLFENMGLAIRPVYIEIVRWGGGADELFNNKNTTIQKHDYREKCILCGQ